jgi:hypothetical protein
LAAAILQPPISKAHSVNRSYLVAVTAVFLLAGPVVSRSQAAELLVAHVVFDAPQSLSSAYAIASAGGAEDPHQVYFGYDIDATWGYGYYGWEDTTGLTPSEAETVLEDSIEAQLAEHASNSGDPDDEEYVEAILDLVQTSGVVVEAMHVVVASCEASADLMSVSHVAAVTVLDGMCTDDPDQLALAVIVLS